MTTYGETKKNAIEKWWPRKFGYNALPNLAVPLLGLILLFCNKKEKTILATLGSR